MRLCDGVAGGWMGVHREKSACVILAGSWAQNGAVCIHYQSSVLTEICSIS